MTENKFKYRLDKRSRRITWITLTSIVVVFGGLWAFSLGEYLPAWFLSIATAFVCLAILSIPRSLRITEQALEIGCMVEITHIPYEHIESVRRIGRTELGLIIPLFASPGVFGYFGWWLDVRNWEIIKVYASSWHGLVLIEDIYEQRYLVNADDPDRLVEALETECAHHKEL
jgi:hypothetical protein